MYSVTVSPSPEVNEEGSVISCSSPIYPTIDHLEEVFINTNPLSVVVIIELPLVGV